jgi:diguanylate cyclase (GGDEF)-like protein
MSDSPEPRAGGVSGTGPAVVRHQHDVLVESWIRAIAGTTFVTGGRGQVRIVLDELLRRLVAALTAEPFEAAPGFQVGADLVTSQISSPHALGNTLALLDRELIPGLEITHPDAPARLAALLGQLAAGFTLTMRTVALAAAEDINRAERVAWRERQAALNRRLQQALLCEKLTGLPNRTHLVSWLGKLLTDQPGCPRLGICLVDLDRFKAVNYSFGHDGGDRLLRAVARRFRTIADKSGLFLAHLGGDQFVFVVENTTGIDDVAKVADLVLRALRNPLTLSGHQLSVAASAGIVEHAASDLEPAGLLRTAEITMGWAKRHHRGHWATFDPSSYAGEVQRHALAAAMPAALAAGEFTLAYQPLVRLAGRRVVGVEALARWRRPTHGLISPARFIPLAESTGLIVPLGLALLEQACGQAAVWHQGDGDQFMVSVNLAVTQLRSPGLAAAIATVLDRTGLPPGQLQLEITESAMVNMGATALDTLRALARMELKLAIDDFGTGYSSLAYLADLPIHAIKLAPGFLRGRDDPHSDNTILPALINLGHDLNLTVTAKGIETAAQAEQLTALGCDIGQGFYLGRPATAEDLTDLPMAPEL